MTTQDNNHAKEQAEAQLSSIRNMLAAADLDWERLEELREERENLAAEIDNAEEDPEDGDGVELLICEEALAQWEAENAEELAELEEQAGEYASREEAESAIYENPLSIEYRSGWASSPDEMVAEEFQILLCTGGPAVRIMGELDFSGQPHRAWFEYQDWGTPWTMLFDGQSDALEYAQRVICL